MELEEIIEKYEIEIVELTKMQKHSSNNSIDMKSWFNARIETILEILKDLKQLSIASSDRSALKEKTCHREERDCGIRAEPEHLACNGCHSWY